MRSKPTAPPRAIGSNKPFVTEYRLSFKDPTASQKKKFTSKKSVVKPKPVEIIKGPSLPAAAEKAVEPSVSHHSTSLTLPAMMTGAAFANLSLDAYKTRRRNLALEHKKEQHQRYNVINGVKFEGDPSSGFKEGRRAVIITFNHLDTITNARSPGYNIITGHDALSGKTPQEIEKIYGANQKPAAH